jgi:hypothetical protein
VNISQKSKSIPQDRQLGAGVLPAVDLGLPVLTMCAARCAHIWELTSTSIMLDSGAPNQPHNFGFVFILSRTTCMIWQVFAQYICAVQREQFRK